MFGEDESHLTSARERVCGSDRDEKSQSKMWGGCERINN